MKSNNQADEATRLETPVKDSVFQELSLGDVILISGYLYTGRDAVLPKIVKLIESGSLDEQGIDLVGTVIFHTAVSPAGIGPTSSNKLDIESSIPALSKAGVKIHLGKGAISKMTVDALKEHKSLYAVTPPVSSLLTSKIEEQKVVAYPEEGMEAFHRLRVVEFPAVIAAIHGDTVYAR